MNRILVTGATSRIGRELISQLLARGVQVRALVRNPESAAFPQEVEVVRGDLIEPHSFVHCAAGVDAVFLLWTASQSAVAGSLDARLTRARRIVFLSSPYKTPHPFFQGGQPNQVSALHSEIERRIANSGSDWTFLRPGMFASNALRWWASQIRAGASVIRWPYAAAPTAPVHERDIAAVAVRALCEHGHTGAEYVLTGPESLSQSEQLSIIGHEIGLPLRMEEISPQQARSEPWFAPLPAWVVDMLFGAWSATIGQPAYVTSTIADVTGAPARTFRKWVSDCAAELRDTAL